MSTIRTIGFTMTPGGHVRNAIKRVALSVD